MITNYKGIVDCINDDFKYLTDENYLQCIDGSIINTKYNFVFPHESPNDSFFKGDPKKWQEDKNHFIKDNYSYLKTKRYTAKE